MTGENAAIAAAKEQAAVGVLRNYFCPKCGAVGDVRWVRAVTQEQWDDAQAEVTAARDKYQAEYDAHVAKSKRGYLSWYRSFWPPIPDSWWGPAREGLEHGEHLACVCPRCAYRWRDAVIAATADTPIHDELAASRA